MYQPIQLNKTTTLPVRNSISRSPWRRDLRLIGLALVCFALSPAAQAVNPPPDGGYAGENTAEGTNALFNLTSGGFGNTAAGYRALYFNTTGSYNTAIGLHTLERNTTAYYNTANGSNALRLNTTGLQNTANGVNALYENTTGVNNTAEGFVALQRNTTGNGNIALGASAGSRLTTGNDNIAIGHVGVAGESNHIRIGKIGTQTATYIAGIHGATVANGVQVVAGPNGRLGTVASSARFKTAIKPMDKASEAILVLKPVSFRYKQGIDPDSIPQFGLVAEEVEKVNPDLIVRDEKGEVYSVRYEAVNAMLLNEFLKQHRKVEEMETKAMQQQKQFESAFATQEAMIERQQKQIESLTAGLQKVSAKLESSERRPYRLADNQGK